MNKKIVIGMSGGVDSSVAAALLKEQGYEVTGMMLRLWSEPGCEDLNQCCTPEAMQLARRVAAKLGIPFYVVDAQGPFFEVVVQYFLDGYTQGVTPNPCLMCNRHIRWEFLLNHALQLGADYFATGHYARIVRQEGEPVRLLAGDDPNKDQSYVLSVLNQDQLSKTLLPLGEITKEEVREIARKYKLPAANIKDSQDLCFLSGRNYSSFLSTYAPNANQPGNILLKDGGKVGEHEGLALYTIGQRKGLGIAFPEPLYVLEKRLDANALIVGTIDQLGKESLIAGNINWISGTPQKKDFRATVKIRYKASPMVGTVTILPDNEIGIQFGKPLRDITPGQAAVIYNGNEVIASSIILRAE
ncbi:MAG: tRNA 2-thiouridine(34) synthase MnmA [Anaerolineales bacterium]|nr:tRNA 2-thiouridine(34) synthase MnmA [Anaerolineales bacterium]